MIEALLRLNGEYARALDDDRLEDWPGFFVEDCLYKITSADNYAQGMEAGLIYADSRAMLQDRVTALRKASVYERQRYRHVLGAPLVLGEEGGAKRVETSFLVVRVMRDGTMDLFACGRYLDRVVEQGGKAKLKERLVVCDSSRIDTLIALPL
jgi:3-phenylpropionate/cinnamic acid dioxygenase small subunit